MFIAPRVGVPKSGGIDKTAVGCGYLREISDPQSIRAVRLSCTVPTT